MPQSPPSFQRRQVTVNPSADDNVVYYYDGDGWYSSVGLSLLLLPSQQINYVTDSSTCRPIQTAYIVKWSLIGAFFFFLAIFLLLAYFHAQHRIKKGLRPLWYHRVRKLICLSL
jgi:hypothetical protein